MIDRSLPAPAAVRDALARDATLSDTLAELGLTHAPVDFGIRRVMRGPVELTRGTARDVWTWLHELETGGQS